MGRSFEETSAINTPADTRPPSDAPTFGRASVSASVGASEPALLTEDELTEIRLFDIAFGDASELGLP